MNGLQGVYKQNKDISKLREQILDLMFNESRNESRRSLDLDFKTLRKINKLRISLDEVTFKRNKEIKRHYSGRIRISIPINLPTFNIKIIGMDIGDDLTTFNMTPLWFNPDDETEALKNIKYPPDISEKRPFDTVARFRTVKKEKTNDFIHKPIEVQEDSTETLVLALDAFVQQFGGKLSFTNDDLSFEESAHRTACGVANLGSAHLLASEYIPSAKFTLILDLDYNDLAQSTERMQDFVLTFTHAIVQDLSCDSDYVRVTSVEKSTKAKGKSELNLALTATDKDKTEELADTLKAHARTGFSNKNILGHIIPDEYDCKWMPLLSYLQLKPIDFNPKYNVDYRQKMPDELKRGGEPYYLPKGWYRHALRMDNKYDDNQRWLGSVNGPQEWPVAFHGTRWNAVRGITDKGLLISTVRVDLTKDEAIELVGEKVNRPGLYVATHCNGGSHPRYTEEFEVRTLSQKIEIFQVVFQCRLRPASFTRHKGPVDVGQAWRIVDPTAVRPYGILLKNKETEVSYEK